MRIHNSHDLIGGGLLVLAGLLMAITAMQNYPLGVLSEMGPGMLPTILGWMLVAIGALIALLAWLRQQDADDPDAPRLQLRPAIAVIGAIASFAITVDLFGMVAGVVILSAVGALADNKLGIRGVLGLSLVLAALAVGIFHFGLAMPIPIFAWPF